MKKYLIYILILAAASIATLVVILTGDFGDVLKYIKNANLGWILLGFALILVACFIDSVGLTASTRLYYPNYKLYRGYLNTIIGSFFAAITPSSSGSQFGQLYCFNKQGVDSKHSLSILLMNTISFEISIILFTALTIITSFNSTFSKLPSFQGLNILWLSAIGFALHILFISFLFFAAFSSKFQKFLGFIFIKVLGKLKIFKNPEQKFENFLKKSIEFRTEAAKLFKNFKVFLIVIFSHMGKFFLMCAVPIIVYLAIGLELPTDNVWSFFWTLISLNSFVSLITFFFPVPGASGGAETSFGVMFSFVFPKVMVGSAVLIWRFISFYFPLFVGFLVFVIYRSRGKDRNTTKDTPEVSDETISLETSDESVSIEATDIPVEATDNPVI